MNDNSASVLVPILIFIIVFVFNILYTRMQCINLCKYLHILVENRFSLVLTLIRFYSYNLKFVCRKIKQIIWLTLSILMLQHIRIRAIFISKINFF